MTTDNTTPKHYTNPLGDVTTPIGEYPTAGIIYGPTYDMQLFIRSIKQYGKNGEEPQYVHQLQGYERHDLKKNGMPKARGQNKINLNAYHAGRRVVLDDAGRGITDLIRKLGQARDEFRKAQDKMHDAQRELVSKLKEQHKELIRHHVARFREDLQRVPEAYR